MFKEEFDKFLEKWDKKEEIIILSHSYPDPDSMASSLGLKHLLKLNGIKSQIYYSGEIDRPMNKAMKNVLKLNLVQIPNGDRISGNIICVDCTENNAQMTGTPIFVIDHHKVKSGAVNQIIDSSYGACATMVYKLLKEYGFQVGEETKNLVTALLLGIKTDTRDLLSEATSPEDFKIYEELGVVADREAIRKIMNFNLPRYSFDLRTALYKEGNTYENNGIFVGGLGFIESDQKGVLSMYSEDYVRIPEITTAIIFAIVDNQHLEVSIRSEDVSLDVDSFCKKLFGKQGGGADNKGGASVDLSFWSNQDEDSKQDFWKNTTKQMFNKVFKSEWKD